MNLGYQGKVAMVAASSKGLGYGVAKAIAHEGASVSMGSRTENEIQEAAQRLGAESGSKVKGFRLDAADASSIQNWTDATIAAFGRIDCLLVNAGGPKPGMFDSFTDQDWFDAFNLTLMSSVRMIRSVVPHMKKQGRGSILVVTSSSIKEPIDILLLSNVMRSGVTSLVKSLSRELAPHSIRINNIVPGRIDTDRVRSLDAINASKLGIDVEKQKESIEKTIPLGRYGTIDEFGKSAAFLLSDAASYVTGETFVVDGGSMRTVW